MKNLILIGLIFLFYSQSFGQNQYPISTIFKGESVVILTKRQSEEINNYISNLENRVEILENERFNLVDVNLQLTCIDELGKIKLQNDSLKMVNDSLFKNIQCNLDSVKNFKKRIYDLCTSNNVPSGVIIYRKNMIDTNLYMIDLSNYNMILKTVYNYSPYQSREKVILLPVRKNRRWIIDIPQPQNLGLHLHPHDGIDGKNKKLVW